MKKAAAIAALMFVVGSAGVSAEVVNGSPANGIIAFATDNSTYTTTYIKWEYVAPGIIVASFVIIFTPKKLSKSKRKRKKS